MALADELAWTSATELARRIRARELSPVEVVDATIARIEARNPSTGALVYLGFDDARAAAREAERAVTAGEALGPLHGVPTVMKDLFDFKPGWPTTFGGVRALEHFVPDFWCLWAERIERAGAILVGKGNSPVMGFRGTCDNPLFGPSRNPFDLARNTGGSSGGCAGAVADGLVPIAEGTDGGGSIRIPASFCGVYGYKPSFGRVPYTARPNGFVGTDPFLFEGPITRTVADAALAMEALAGYDPRDPFALDERVDFTGALDRGIEGLRIGYSPDLGVFPVDRRVADLVRGAVEAWERAGARVEEVRVDLPYGQRELSDLWCRQIIPGNVGAIEGFKREGLDLLADHRQDLPPAYLEWVERGYALTVPELQRDQVMRTEVHDAIQRVFETVDLLVTPTLACLPVPNAGDGDTMGPAEVEGEAVDRLIGWCLTYPLNFTGHPAASAPAGLVEGLPVGMQLVGRRYADVDVLAASAAWEEVRPWAATYAGPEARPLEAPA